MLPRRLLAATAIFVSLSAIAATNAPRVARQPPCGLCSASVNANQPGGAGRSIVITATSSTSGVCQLDDVADCVPDTGCNISADVSVTAPANELVDDGMGNCIVGGGGATMTQTYSTTSLPCGQNATVTFSWYTAGTCAAPGPLLATGSLVLACGTCQ